MNEPETQPEPFPPAFCLDIPWNIPGRPVTNRGLDLESGMCEPFPVKSVVAQDTESGGHAEAATGPVKPFGARRVQGPLGSNEDINIHPLHSDGNPCRQAHGLHAGRRDRGRKHRPDVRVGQRPDSLAPSRSGRQVLGATRRGLPPEGGTVRDGFRNGLKICRKALETEKSVTTTRRRWENLASANAFWPISELRHGEPQAYD